jgi:hypothetical protein
MEHKTRLKESLLISLEELALWQANYNIVLCIAYHVGCPSTGCEYLFIFASV